jgi:hypothetical protein
MNINKLRKLIATALTVVDELESSKSSASDKKQKGKTSASKPKPSSRTTNPAAKGG